MGIEIPKLDYAEALKNADYGARVFKEAMQNPGFLFLHNVPGYDAVKLKQWTTWFFKTLTDSERLTLRTNPYRGFVPANPDAASSYKQLYEIGGLSESREEDFILCDATPWPEEAGFRAFMMDYYRCMSHVGLNLLKDGSYVPVESGEEGLFVNIGDLLVSLVGGGVKATRHRVVAHCIGLGDHGVERFSVPFFLEPDPFMELRLGGKTKTYGVQVLQKCTIFFEHAHLLATVKADPRYRDLPEFREAEPLTEEEATAL